MSEDNNKAVVVRSTVEPKADYNSYRDILRFDFVYSCAYCSIMESEAAGIGFEIDHYYPKNTHPELRNDYSNLMWSCRVCNRYKGAYDPDEHAILKGNIILRPDKDDPRQHMELVKHSLRAETHTGEFNIIILYLNRLHLRKLRELRERFYQSRQYIADGIRRLCSLKIDQFRPEHRAIYLNLRGRVLAREEKLCDSLESLIRDFARSPFLDDDTEKKAFIKRRRDYLKEQKVIGIPI